MKLVSIAMVIVGALAPMLLNAEDVIGLHITTIKSLESLLVQVYSRMHLFLSMESYLERQDVAKDGFRQLQSQFVANHEQFSESIIEFLNKRFATVAYRSWHIPNNKKGDDDKIEDCDYTKKWENNITNYVTTTDDYLNYSNATNAISFAGRIHCDLYQKVKKLRKNAESEEQNDFHLQDWLDGKLVSLMNLMNKLLILQTRLKRVPQIGIAELIIDAELTKYGTTQYQI